MRQTVATYVAGATVSGIVGQLTNRFWGLTGRMSVLSEIRSIPEAIRSLTAAVRDLAMLTRANGPAEERLQELERSRAMWEAEIEGQMSKADSRYKAAAGSEARARTMERNAEKLADPFAEEGDDVEEGIPPVYAGVRNGETLQPVHEDLGLLSPKQLALRMKFS